MSESSSIPPVAGFSGEPPPPYPPPAADLPTAPPGTQSQGETSGTKEVAKEQASHVGQEAAHAGQHVAGVAKEQVAEVTQQAGQQAKQLLGQAQSQAKEQAGAQQQKLVGGLRSLSDELSSMSSNGSNQGLASDLARQAAERTSAVAGWLDGREPKAVLDEVTQFARRRPGAFLAIAAGLGFVAGRLTRGIANASGDDGNSAAQPAPSTTPAVRPQPTPYPPVTAPPVPADVDLRVVDDPSIVPGLPPSAGEAYLGGER